ncbi:MAG: non-canonical purine NTP pyrophosphatase [Candidatus Gottesmanbacteria bacterium]
MKRLLIATTNPGKLTEIKFFLKEIPIKLVSLTDLGIKDKVEEDGKTFEENARKKAIYYCKISGIPTIADDGGLEIDYLNGEPGVKSHRWIDNKVNSDEELIKYTLEKLKGLPFDKRGAQLRTVIALTIPNGSTFISESIIRGVISEKAASFRTPGFPYRSLLYLPESGKFYHQDDLTEEENIKYNHRGKALRKLKRIIKEKVLK